MPIPEFNEIKAPAPQFLANGNLHSLSEVHTTLAEHFNLTVRIDGDRLASLMMEHNIGVAKSHSYDVKHVDSDYFDQD